jgi:hypothetical protein
MAMGSTLTENEYQGYRLGRKGGRWVELTALPPSCTECLETLGASIFWNPKGLYSDCFILHSAKYSQIMLEVCAETHKGRPLNCALSSDFNQKWNVLTDFNRISYLSWFMETSLAILALVLTDIAQWLVAVLEVIVASATKIFQTMIFRFFEPETVYIWGCLHMFYRLLRPVYVKTLKCKWNFTCYFICAWNVSYVT